jgi:hypothetical protein
VHFKEPFIVEVDSFADGVDETFGEVIDVFALSETFLGEPDIFGGV